MPTQWLKIILVCSFVLQVKTWDTEDLEIFDLVEEIGGNFYEIIGVDQSATNVEVRRAYRKLSVQMHPDKGGDEEKFRQLNLIYEVLKDESRRTKYNLVLEQGLPDWKQPVFYYRRVRKLGLLEMTGLLLLILTVGQFVVSWSVYFEKKFELEEVFRSAKKKQDRKSRKKRSGMDDDEFEEHLQNELNVIPRPRWQDLIPFWVVRVSLTGMMGLPQMMKEAREKMQVKEKMEEEEEEEETEQEATKRRRRVETPDFNYKPTISDDLGPAVSYTTPLATEDPTGHLKQVKDGEWTDDELFLLAKAMVKFPGGTSKRWEKVAEMVGRPVAEVTSKSKEVKSGYAKQVDPASQGTTGLSGNAVTLKKGKSPADEIISTRSNYDIMNSDAPEQGQRRQRPTKVTKSVDRTLLISQSQPAATQSQPTATQRQQAATQRQPTATQSQPTSDTAKSADAGSGKQLAAETDAGDKVLKVDTGQEGQLWTQNQQKILEWALAQYPKGTEDRWDKVAEHIPGKTKEDCIARFKYLADIIKKKRAQKSS